MNYFKNIIILLLLINCNIFAQCLTGNPSGTTCSGGGGALTNSYNFNTADETRWVSGTSSLGTPIMNATTCTLRVCGTLTLTDLQLNTSAARVVIEPGATLNMSGSWSPSQGIITNYGTVNIAGDLTLNAAKFINASTSSVLSLTGGGRTLTVNNSSSNLVNLGTITTDNLTIQGTVAGIVCLQNNSCLNISGNFTNNQTNSITNGSVSPTKAAIRYNGTATFNNSLTNSSTVYLCKNGASAPANIGSATWTNNCSSGCSTILPVKLLYFKTTSNNGYVGIIWSTASETNNDYFTIEKSKNLSDFNYITRVNGNGTKNTISNYVIKDSSPIIGLAYYRLTQTDYNGLSEILSETVVDYVETKEWGVLYPYDINSIMLITNEKSGLINVILQDMGGKIIYEGEYICNGSVLINIIDKVPNIKTGLYVLKIYNQNNFLYKEIILK